MIDYIILALLVVMGTIFSMGKFQKVIKLLYSLKKYETYEKNIPAITKAIGAECFFLGFVMIFWIVGNNTGNHIFFIIGTVLFTASIIFTYIFTHVSKRFRK